MFCVCVGAKNIQSRGMVHSDSVDIPLGLIEGRSGADHHPRAALRLPRLPAGLGTGCAGRCLRDEEEGADMNSYVVIEVVKGGLNEL